MSKMMAVEIKEQWEDIGDGIKRLPVPGGWLLKTYLSDTSGVTVYQIFIADSDSDHSWSGSRGL